MLNVYATSYKRLSLSLCTKLPLPKLADSRGLSSAYIPQGVKALHAVCRKQLFMLSAGPHCDICIHRLPSVSFAQHQ